LQRLKVRPHVAVGGVSSPFDGKLRRMSRFLAPRTHQRTNRYNNTGKCDPRGEPYHFTISRRRLAFIKLRIDKLRIGAFLESSMAILTTNAVPWK